MPLVYQWNPLAIKIPVAYHWYATGIHVASGIPMAFCLSFIGMPLFYTTANGISLVYHFLLEETGLFSLRMGLSASHVCVVFIGRAGRYFNFESFWPLFLNVGFFEKRNMLY